MNTSHHEPGAKNQHHYRGLLIMAAFSFASMYVLMYAMVNAAGNVYNNVNQAYMAALMAAPMVQQAEIDQMTAKRHQFGN